MTPERDDARGASGRRPGDERRGKAGGDLPIFGLFRRGDSHMKLPGAVFVSAGILLSRLAGLVRLLVFAHYFGLQSDAADAFNAAFRIPNFLQNLFGEGTLSASFIPVYASLLARDDRREADRVAGAVVSLLAWLVSGIVRIGVLATPVLIDAIAPGFP